MSLRDSFKSSKVLEVLKVSRFLPNGVTVALQILVLSVWVRILVWQQQKLTSNAEVNLV